MEYKCDTCIKTFPNMRGLQMHWRKGIHLKVSAAVAKTNSETFSSSADASSLKKNKRLSVLIEGGERKKIRSGPICYDLNALEAQMQNNDDSFEDGTHDCDEQSDSDDSYYGTASVDDEEDYIENEQYFSSYATNIFSMNQQLVDTSSNKYHHPMNREFNDGPISCYYDYQLLLYNRVYGEAAFEAKNIKEFKNLLTGRDTEKTSRMMEIYTFAKDCNISSVNGDRLLKLISHNKEVSKKEQYTSWRSFDRWIQKETDFYSSVKKVISWPENWKMNQWDHSNLRCPEEVEIRMRDIMQLIADQCVSPHLQFLWKDEIKIRSYKPSNDSGENVFCDLMSSEWVFEEQKLISQFDKDGILLPVMLYYDGVCPDKNMNTSLSPVMGTLGWYGRKLLQNYCSKFVVGYLSEMNVSEVVIVHHLMKVCKMKKTKALKNINIFKKNLFFEFWKVLLETLKPAATRGIKLKILGKDGTSTFYPRIAFHAGDDPAQHDVASIKNGPMVRYSCIQCMYDSRKGGPYVYKPENVRKLTDTLKNDIRTAEKCQMKYLNDEHIEANERLFVKDLESKGFHPINNPFFDAPFGSNNSIYNSPTDLMHLFSAGLIKSVLLWTMIIIDAVSKCAGFSQNKGLFDIRLKQFPIIPKNIPHLYMRKFSKGLMYIITKKTKQEKAYATGSGGKFRSVEFVSALFQVRFVVCKYIFNYLFSYIKLDVF